MSRATIRLPACYDPCGLPELPKTLEFQTISDEETIGLGRKLARLLPRRAAVLLIGNLGAGKTTLAKGIISGLGVAEPHDVASPTFTLIHEYGPPAAPTEFGPAAGNAKNGAREVSVYHVDLYRLESAAEVASLGLDDIFDRDAIVLLEWGERFPELLPEGTIRIHLEPDPASPDSRHIRVFGLPQ